MQPAGAEPPTPSPAEVTRALADVSSGVPEADTRLLQLVYGELRRLASAKMAAQHAAHTLQPTALVHEAYLRLLGGGSSPAFRDRSHFFTVAAAAMRSILVDHARRKQAEKRGGAGAARVTLHPELVGERDPLERVLQVHELLDRLAAAHPRPARVVELLFFAGLDVEAAAGVLDVSDRTVKRDWRFARAWLLRRMPEG